MSIGRSELSRRKDDGDAPTYSSIVLFYCWVDPNPVPSLATSHRAPADDITADVTVTSQTRHCSLMPSDVLESSKGHVSSYPILNFVAMTWSVYLLSMRVIKPVWLQISSCGYFPPVAASVMQKAFICLFRHNTVVKPERKKNETVHCSLN